MVKAFKAERQFAVPVIRRDFAAVRRPDDSGRVHRKPYGEFHIDQRNVRQFLLIIDDAEEESAAVFAFEQGQFDGFREIARGGDENGRTAFQQLTQERLLGTVSFRRQRGVEIEA